jgi:rfaE bifunctional protein nucleotidyltransferase chain/domain
VVVGDALLDRDLDGHAERLCPDAPAPVVDRPSERRRPGGAGLAAALAAGDGREVTLVCALGDDAAGALLRRLLEERGVAVVDLGLDGATPEKVRVCADGRPLARLDYGGPASPARPPGRDALRLVGEAGTVLVSDYGRGVAADPGIRAALAARAGRVVWDPHPRGPSPVPGVALLTPNAAEAARMAPEPAGDGVAGWSARAAAILGRTGAERVAVTLGARGAVLAERGLPALAVPAPREAGGDAAGAGDRFAGTAAGLLADGALPMDAVIGAVEAATSFVVAGGAASWPAAEPPRRDAPREAAEVVARVRARGGRVVAAGGCFDLLHPGHVRMLEAARSLGDCLVVLLNSDRSVRRLKGADRPLVPEADRAAVLRGLRAVDAVEVFDEDTPAAALERLRPDLFAKGADYAVADLPEAAVLRRWGGEAVVVPFVAGRSTTRLIEEVAQRVV